MVHFFMSSIAPRRTDQPIKQRRRGPAAPVHALRVPLYGPDRKSLVLHSLCESVSVGLAPCDGLETFAELVEGLVVLAVYFHGLAVKVS